MYVAVVPNRNSPPAVLLRESFREKGKVHNRTIANLSHWPSVKVDALRAVLKGSTTLGTPLPQAFHIVRSRPHGHVAAVLGALRKLHLDRLLDGHADRYRDLVLALIVARVLAPASKLATSRTLHPDTLSSTLGEVLHLSTPSPRMNCTRLWIGCCLSRPASKRLWLNVTWRKDLSCFTI